MRDRIFLTSIITLAIGVPISLFGLEYFSDSVTSLLIFILITGILSFLISLFLIKSRDQILTYIFKTSRISIDEIIEPLLDSIEGLTSSDPEIKKQVPEKLKSFLLSSGARYTWLSTRRWIISISFGILLAFGGLITAYQLIKQNEILIAQNQFFKNQVITESIKTSLDNIFGDVRPGQRENALRDYLAIMGTEFPKQKINFSSVSFEEMNLDDIEFKDVNFRRARFSETTIERSGFKNVNFEGTRFLYTNFDGSTFIECNFENSKFNEEFLEEEIKELMELMELMEEIEELVKVNDSIKIFAESSSRFSSYDLFQRQSKFKNTVFSDCIFKGDVRMNFVDFGNASFQGCKWEFNIETTSVFGVNFMNTTGIPDEIISKISENYGLTNVKDVQNQIDFLQRNRSKFDDYSRRKKLESYLNYLHSLLI